MCSEAEDSRVGSLESDGIGANIVATVKLDRAFNEAFTTLSEFIGMRDVIVLLGASQGLQVHLSQVHTILWLLNGLRIW